MREVKRTSRIKLEVSQCLVKVAANGISDALSRCVMEQYGLL
jgi:hypothetical protein